MKPIACAVVAIVLHGLIEISSLATTLSAPQRFNLLTVHDPEFSNMAIDIDHLHNNARDEIHTQMSEEGMKRRDAESAEFRTESGLCALRASAFQSPFRPWSGILDHGDRY